MNELKPCPFCGGEVEILIGDDEGNIRDEDYEFDAWSGLSYMLHHDIDLNKDCPIASWRGDNFGSKLYDSREDAIKDWNKRKGESS